MDRVQVPTQHPTGEQRGMEGERPQNSVVSEKKALGSQILKGKKRQRLNREEVTFEVEIIM